jgi:hypothetical protein
MWDSNPHGLRHQILSLACLPISAIAHGRSERTAPLAVWHRAAARVKPLLRKRFVWSGVSSYADGCAGGRSSAFGA